MATRGFLGRRSGSDGTAERLPPGQFLESGFPVLSAGPTPRIKTDDWTFTLKNGIRPVKSWTWAEFNALPQTKMTRDIHCVTTWSKFDTAWEGVLVDDILADAGIEPPTDFTLAHSFDGYTTNVPTADLVGGKAMVALRYEGKPIPPDHGGPARLLVPHLYFWKSAKWINGLQFTRRTNWGSGNCAAITATAIRGGSSATPMTRMDDIHARTACRELGPFLPLMRWQTATITEIMRRSPTVSELLLQAAGVHPVHRRPACQRAADGARWLPRAAQLFHRLGAGDDRPYRAGDRAAGRRRGVALLPRGGRGRRRDRALGRRSAGISSGAQTMAGRCC